MSGRRSRANASARRWARRRCPCSSSNPWPRARACAKALRNVLAWVVVLAGDKPTPAEEMTGGEGGSTKEDTRYRMMKSRFPFECAACGKRGEKDADIVYDAQTKKAVHAACFKPEAKPAETPNANPKPAAPAA